MIESTDASPQVQTLRHEDSSEPRTIFAIPRPGWAQDIHIGQNLNAAVVTHLWTAPTVAAGGIFCGDVGAPLQVLVQQLDDLVVDDDTVTYKKGRPVIFLAEADIEFTATTEARRYAAAIVEACDRLDADPAAQL